ncbi:hypothetical protein ABZ354_14715 [Streptomyces sp. NPDC005925]|uniref:hypothetical protein n=1 Tax=Streptomyces sp. NPDC005925 TaxID=3157172 RepID=UPI00340E20C3
MSFGDPNNPYGPPPGQPPTGPDYGYPHQQYPQQGYGGYPAPPPGGFGYPGGPVDMPGTVKAARVMLFVLGGFQALGGLVMVLASAWFADLIDDEISSDSTISSQDAETVADIGTGVLIVLGVFVLAFALWAILTGLKFATGRGGARVSAIIYSSLVVLFSLVSLVGANVFALISLVLGILIIVFCANRNGSLWFNRPQY